MRVPSPTGRLVRSVVLLALTCGAVVLGPALARASVQTGPPVDPEGVGAIALCGPSGQPLTGGLLSTKPFIWKAIGTVAPPAAVAGPGGLAVLNIYQERPGVAPAEWSGANLTAFTRYSTNSHPTVQFTSKDLSLQDIVDEYPPLGSGYYALRMKYAKVDSSNETPDYAVTTIQVVGKVWHVVSGAALACSAGEGKSGEVYAGAAPAAPAPGYAAAVTAASKQAAAEPAADTHAPSASPSQQASSGTHVGADASTSTAAGPRSGHSSSSADSVWIALAVVGGLALLGAGFAAGRRRRS